MPPHSILVARSISPADLPLLRQCAGLVTEQGGLAGHGAILARELGVPAVVGVAEAMKRLLTGQQIAIDGDRGEVDLAPGEPISDAQPQERSTFSQSYPISTKLFVNLSQPSLVDRAARMPVDGVGLIRAELMAIEVLDGRSPQVWLQDDRRDEFIDRVAGGVERFARAFAPRPVFYRAFDTLGDEMSSPLGTRGTYRTCLNPQLFEWELAALVRVRQSYPNVHLILPFVRTVEEFCFCQTLVDRAGLLGSRGGLWGTAMQLWIMAEVPSVLFLLPDYARSGVRGIAIGCNDLTQLLLGADRDCPQMATTFDTCHQAVMRAMRQLVETAKQQGIPCSICGDAPARYPELIEALVQWGISAISVPPDSVEFAYDAIVRAEQRLLLNAARNLAQGDGRNDSRE